MKKLLTIILVLSALVTKAQTLHFHQLTVKDGLTHNSVITLAEEAKGCIWVATHGGLFRYDGKQFHTMSVDELPDKRVDRINRASDGTMWVQCFEHHQQVSRYDTLTHHFTTYNVSDLSDSIRQQVVLPLNRTFADPHSSRVWTIEKRQLLQTDTLQPQSQFTYTGQTALDAGLKDEIFYSLLLDRQGILWAGSANNGLFFADTRQSHYRRLVCQPSPLVRATCKDSKGVLWIAIGDQQVLTMPQEAAYVNRVDYPMTDSIEGRRIRTIIEDCKGRLWMGGHDGLYVKEDAASDFSRVAFGSNVQSHVFCLCKARDGLLWIGTDQGLFLLKLDEQPFKPLLVDSTVTYISKIAVDENRVWMTTDKGLFCRADGKTTQWYQEAAHTIVIDPRGQTWIGTDNGLIQVTNQGVRPVSTAADGHTVKDLLCWRDFLWCSHEQGLCCINIYTGQSTTIHTEHNEYLDGSASIDASTGTLYFGGTMGIDCLQADSLEEQLRSGIAQLWLEEVREELRVQSDDSCSPIWPYAILSILMVCAALGFTYYYIRRKKTALAHRTGHEEESHEEESHEDRATEPELKQVPEVPAIETPTPHTDTAQPLPKEPSPFILKATAIAEAHIADTEFTAELMAQEMAMSRTKLFMLMKKETDKAVMEFVRDIRLEYAARQLEAGTPVGEIYTACGFSDPSSFRRSFVKKFGVNPSQYRQQHLKQAATS
jgi:AraC-like DNA-binding protein